MSLDGDIVSAWEIAARDLGIRAIAPSTFVSKDAKQFECEAHILDFGSPEGAIALSEKSRQPSTPLLWSSVLLTPYRRYDRQLFIETLEDWGWFGEGSAPQWYAGTPKRAD